MTKGCATVSAHPFRTVGAVSGLNPAQQQLIDLLGKADTEPEPFPTEVAEDLRAELEAATAPLLGDLGGERLFVSKSALAGIHGCEAQHVASRDHFEWSLPSVRGTGAHRAIELSVHWRGDRAPGELVDEALARLANDEFGPSSFLQSLGEGDRAQLRSEATDLTAKFLECFPPLRDSWWARSEASIKHELHDGLIILSGRPDLTLGRPRGTTPTKVLLDLKTGFRSPAHREDLRFYALVETLRMQVPPRKVATYYVDEARPEAEDVGEPHLRAALRRTIDGITKLVDVLHAGREPQRRVGPTCRWCIVRADCDEGQAYLRQRAEDRDG